jgi:hypothetical protein
MREEKGWFSPSCGTLERPMIVFDVDGDSAVALPTKLPPKEKPRYSLRWLLGLVTCCAVVFACCGFLQRITWRTGHDPTCVEIMGLAAAVETYKNNYHYYPPSRTEDMEAHVRRLFPRCADSVVVPELDPAEALVFFLSGYAHDPRNPLSPNARGMPFFDFAPDRFTDLDGDGWYEYRPLRPDSGNAPYVYFAVPYGDQSYSNPAFKGVARPRPDVPKDFQIMSAGLDGDFGTPGDKRNRAARDNVTSYDGIDLEAP